MKREGSGRGLYQEIISRDGIMLTEVGFCLETEECELLTLSWDCGESLG